MKKFLTDVMLRRLRPPRSGRLEVGDKGPKGIDGLVIRVTPRGTVSFSVAYKVPGEGGVSPTGRLLTGRQHRITLGKYPALGLSEARNKAQEILRTVGEGCDPRPERREQNLIRHTNTVTSVVRRFIEQDAKRTVASWRTIQRCLELHVLPKLGDRPIRDIRRSDIHALLDELVAAERVGTAREVRKHLSRLFNWAADREIVSDNPVHGMKRRDLAPNGGAGRALTDDELRAIWVASGEMGYPFGPWYRLLMLTGQRVNEWQKAQRSEIDAGKRLLEIPAARYKSRRDHVVPLSDPAWEIVDSLPVFCGNDYYLFSTRTGRVPITNSSTAKKRLDKLAVMALGENAVLSPYRIHDLRVTCETRLADLRISQEVRDAVLGHAKKDLQKLYNKHDYMNEKCSALAAYADHIIGVMG